MHDLTTLAIGLPEKPQSGDCFTHFELPDEGLVIAAVADGVGAHTHDWAASQAACAAILPAFNAAHDEEPAARLTRTAAAAHDAVQSLRGAAAGALSTLVLAAWHPASGLCRFVNVGDSRLYLVGDGVPAPLTIDDARGVVLRRAGQVILQNGAVAFSRALTRALGQSEPLDFTAQSVQVDPGAMLVLTTDGGHELPGFAQRLLEVQNHLDLAEATQALIGSLCRDHAKDDATLILMRDTTCPPAVREQALCALHAGKGLTGPGRYGHLMISVAVEDMARCARTGDMEGALRVLEVMVTARLRPRRRDAMVVIRALIDDGRPETVRAYRRLVDWAGKL
jgi:serine/threonine protein phosphatase PrpC